MKAQARPVLERDDIRLIQHPFVSSEVETRKHCARPLDFARDERVHVKSSRPRLYRHSALWAHPLPESAPC
jgi:hypothetical protein